MFKERFFIFMKAGPSKKAQEAVRESTAKEEAARLKEAQDTLKYQITSGDKGAEGVAESLVSPVEVKKAIENPELIEGLLEKLSTKGYVGKGTKGGQEIMKIIVEKCENSPKLLNKIIDYAKSGRINPTDLTNYRTFSILLTNSKKEEKEELLNLITKNRNGTNAIITNCKIHPETIKLIYDHIKKDNRKILTLNRQSIQILIEKTGKENEIIAVFTENPQNSSRLLEALRNFPTMLKSVFDKYKKEDKLKTLPPEAVVVFMTELLSTDEIEGLYFSHEQIFQIMRNGLGTEKIYQGLTPSAVEGDFNNPKNIVLHEAIIIYKKGDDSDNILKNLNNEQITEMYRRKNVPKKYLQKLRKTKDTEEPIKALGTAKEETLRHQVQGLFKSDEIIVTEDLEIKQNPKLLASKKIKPFPKITITTDPINKQLTINISKYKDLQGETKTFGPDKLKTLVHIKKFLEEKLDKIYQTANKEAPIEKYLSMDIKSAVNDPVKFKEIDESATTSEYTEKWWKRNIEGGFLTEGPIITKILEDEPFNIKDKQKIYETLAKIYKSNGILGKGDEKITIDDVFKATDVKFDFNGEEIRSSEELINHFENIKKEYNNALSSGDAGKIKSSRGKYLNLIGFFEKINTLINAITTTERVQVSVKKPKQAKAVVAPAPVAPAPAAKLKTAPKEKIDIPEGITKEEADKILAKAALEKAAKAKAANLAPAPTAPTAPTAPAKYTYTKKTDLVPSLDSLKGKPDKLTQEIQKIIPDNFKAELKGKDIVLTNKFGITDFRKITIKQVSGKLKVDIPAFRERAGEETTANSLDDLKTFLDKNIKAMLEIANVDKSAEDLLPTLKVEITPKINRPNILKGPMNKKRFEKIQNHPSIKFLLTQSPFNKKTPEDRHKAITAICKNSKIDQDTILKLFPIDGEKNHKDLAKKLTNYKTEYRNAQNTLINKPNDKAAIEAKKDTEQKIGEIINAYKKITQLIEQLKIAKPRKKVGKGKKSKLEAPDKIPDSIITQPTRPVTGDYVFSKKAPAAVTRAKEGLFGHLDHIPGSIGELRGIIKDIKLQDVEINDTKISNINLIDNIYLEKTSEKNVIRLGILETSKIIPSSIPTTYFKTLKLKTLPEENAVELNGKKYITEKALKTAIQETFKKLFESIPKNQKSTELLNPIKQKARIAKLNTGKTIHDSALGKLSAEEWETKKDQISQFKAVKGQLTGKLGVGEKDVPAVLHDIVTPEGKTTLSKIIKNDKINSHLNTRLLDPTLIHACFSEGKGHTYKGKIDNTEGLKTFYTWLVKEVGNAEKKAKEKPKERAKEEEKAMKYKKEIIKIDNFLNSTEKLMNFITISRLKRDKPQLGKKEVKEPTIKIIGVVKTKNNTNLRVREESGKIKIDFSADGKKWSVVKAENVVTTKTDGKGITCDIKDAEKNIIYKLQLDDNNKITLKTDKETNPETGKEANEPTTKIISSITTIHGSQLRVREAGGKIKIDFLDEKKWFVAKNVSTEKIAKTEETKYTIKNDDGRIIYRLTLNEENEITHVESRNIAFGGTPGGIAKPLSVSNIDDTRETKKALEGKDVTYISSKLDGEKLTHKLKHKSIAFTLRKDSEKYKVKIEDKVEITVDKPLDKTIDTVKNLTGIIDKMREVSKGTEFTYEIFEIKDAKLSNKLKLGDTEVIIELENPNAKKINLKFHEQQCKLEGDNLGNCMKQAEKIIREINEIKKRTNKKLKYNKTTFKEKTTKGEIKSHELSYRENKFTLTKTSGGYKITYNKKEEKITNLSELEEKTETLISQQNLSKLTGKLKTNSYYEVKENGQILSKKGATLEKIHKSLVSAGIKADEMPEFFKTNIQEIFGDVETKKFDSYKKKKIKKPYAIAVFSKDKIFGKKTT